ncbi:MAG: T9SS type A sorting domain-containing protein [Bacteroidota bacterium]
MKSFKTLLTCAAIACISVGEINAQESAVHHCGTMEHLAWMKQKDPSLEKRMQDIEVQMEKWAQESANRRPALLPDVIPVVVHVLYANTVQNVSDQAIMNTIQALNEDYGRTAPDTGLTPAVWKPIAASTNIQFCLAQRDPNGAVTNGIERRQTSSGPFDVNDVCKFYGSGGLDAWDVTKYFNLWICDLVPGLGGYGEFPTGNFSNTFGNVTDYTLIGLTGWVATHECGHCFNLRHIWGDDGGSCSGSDNVSDTPNQADATSSPCPTFPATDNCQPNSPGFMFMNYMDYGSEACKNIFTQGQATRAHNALYNLAMSSLLTSDGCQAVFSVNDAGVNAVSIPAPIICDSIFDPAIDLKNFGTGTLSSATINYTIDGSAATTYSWSGSLSSLASTTVTLPTVTLNRGVHTMKVFPTMPNGVNDPNPYNDTTTYIFNIVITGQAAPIVQGFQNQYFPVSGWSIGNYDGGLTWTRVSAHKGTPFGIEMENYNYSSVGAVDDLIVPNVNLVSAGNIPLLSFWVAYAMRTSGISDTLEVVASTDCGANWTSIYKKWQDSLSTVAVTSTPFVPTTAADWRQEIIDLTPFTFSDNVILKFRNINNNQNNLYIDDVNLSFLTGIAETLDGNVVSIYPNPSSGNITINSSRLTSSNLKITLCDAVGRQVLAGNYPLPLLEINLDLASFSNGIYLIHLENGNESFTQKLVLSR